MTICKLISSACAHSIKIPIYALKCNIISIKVPFKLTYMHAKQNIIKIAIDYLHIQTSAMKYSMFHRPYQNKYNYSIETRSLMLAIYFKINHLY